MLLIVHSSQPNKNQRLKIERHEVPRVLMGFAAVAIFAAIIYQFLPDFGADKEKAPYYVQPTYLDACASYVTEKLPQVQPGIARDRCTSAAREFRAVPTRAGIIAAILSELRAEQLEQELKAMRERIGASNPN